MDQMLVVTIMVVVVAIAFDFVNGFHDAANSIATVVATKVLKPKQAVMWAAFFNFIALFVFGTGVAKTVGSGMVALDFVTPAVILSGLFGAVLWGLLTWWWSLPTSSSHALLGGYAGAAMAYAVHQHGWGAISEPIITTGWTKTLIFIVIAPILGLVVGHLLMKLTLAIERRLAPKKFTRTFKVLQLFSSAFLSLMHGGNDAQKTAGIITGALVAGGQLAQFDVPMWVLWMSYATMGLGTFFGGWRIVNTMGNRLTRLKPNGGFCAETSAALSILLATTLHLPVSTTHATTGSILGVGSARRLRAVRWRVAGNIAWAWVMTIPATAISGALVLLLTLQILKQ